MSPVTTHSPAREATGRTDAVERRWRPDRLSDERLLALHRKLERLRARGGAFADVTLSGQVTDRLAPLLNRAGPRPHGSALKAT